jgi:hypothetical protein
MVNMPERSLPRRELGRDLPSFGARSASVIAFGPDDRIGPLPRAGLRTARDRAVMPLALLACALVAAGAAAALLRAGPPVPPAEERVVIPPPPTIVPSLPPPAETAVVQPPAPVAAVSPPEPPTPPVKSTERVAPSTPSQARGPAQDPPPSKPDVVPDEEPTHPPRRRLHRPKPQHPAGEAKATRRPAASPDEDVRETGTTPHAKPSRPVPSSSGNPSSWNLPSVLRPGGL